MITIFYDMIYRDLLFVFETLIQDNRLNMTLKMILMQFEI